MSKMNFDINWLKKPWRGFRTRLSYHGETVFGLSIGANLSNRELDTPEDMEL